MLFKRILCALLCAVTVFSLAACEENEPVSSEVSEVQESSAMSEIPEPESSEFIPSQDLIPSGDTTGDSSDFYAAFSQNPIDKQYDADYAAADAFGMMRAACSSAAERWEAMVDIAYAEAVLCVQGNMQEELQNGQAVWESRVEGDIEDIRAEYGDTNEGILNSEKEIVLYYRSRAMELCETVYNATGELPDFEQVM